MKRLRRETLPVTFEEFMNPVSDPRRKDAPVQVISFTRRSDGPGNPEQLYDFITQLQQGTIVYPNPITRQQVVLPVRPGADISWWSKDFFYLIQLWHDFPETTIRMLETNFRHHFGFTINGPDHSIVEPGVNSTLEDRIDRQLPWLVNKCIQLGEDPAHAIMVKLDPIYIYTFRGRTYDNLDHVPHLCETMKRIGLTRIHMSFIDFSFIRVKPRLRKLEPDLVFDPLALETRLELLKTRVLPFTNAAGITLQTCTAMDSDVSQGACVGFADINSLSGGKAGHLILAKTRLNKACTCYSFRDVGCKFKGCTHGCRYCFANPQIYPLPPPVTTNNVCSDKTDIEDSATS